VLISSGAVCQASGPAAPVCFTNEVAAFTNGQAVVAALQSGDAQSKKQIERLVGSRVLFSGSGRSGSVDLKIADDILVAVEMSPAKAVRPYARMEFAETVGALKSVDFEKRVIHITVQPEDWMVYQAR